MGVSEGLEFKSRNNTDLIIYKLDAGGDYPVHGAYWNGDSWTQMAWTIDGKINPNEDRPLDIDWPQSVVS